MTSILAARLRILAPVALLGGLLGASPGAAQIVAGPWIGMASDIAAERVRLDADAMHRNAPLRRLAFTALGRRFELLLESNDRLKGRLPVERQAALNGLRLYRGTVADMPDSWVRLAEHDGLVSGLFWDGASLFSLEETGNGLLVEEPQDLYRNLAERYSGDLIEAPDGTAAELPSGTSGAGHKIAFPVDPGKTIRVGFVADPSFVATRGSNTETSLLISLNVIDGIFLWQLGVEVELAELILLDSDPFSSNDSETLLAQLSALKQSTPGLASLGLVHLFTGREVQDSKSGGSLLGTAYFGTVCDTVYGVGMTRYRASPNLEAWTAAHELGHNFGAPHDSEAGSACEGAPAGFLMEVFSNSSETFSQCSVDQMVPYINAGPCFVDWQPNDLSLRVVDAVAEIDLQQSGHVIVAVDAAGVVDAAAVEVTIEATGAVALVRAIERTDQVWTCDRFAAPQRCTINYIPRGSTPEFQIEVQATTVGEGTVHVAVDSGNDPNASNNTLDYDFTVPDAIDLHVELDVPPGQGETAAGDLFYPDSPVAMTATVTNRSAKRASDVVMTVDFSEPTSDRAVHGAGLSCTAGTDGSRLECPIGDLSGGQARTVDISFRTRSAIPPDLGAASDGVHVSARAAEPERPGWSNEGALSVRVTASIFDLAIGIEAPTPITVDEPTELMLWIENHGPDTARSVRLAADRFVDSSPNAEYLAFDDSAGSCALDAAGAEWQCAARDLAAGERRAIRVSFLATELGSFRTTVTAGFIGYETDGYVGDLFGHPYNEQFTLVVAEAPADPVPESPPSSTPAPAQPAAPAAASGGGGGAMSILSLLLLLAARLVASRRSGNRIGPGDS